MRCIRFLLALWLPLMLAACAIGGPSTAPLPSYGMGDAYRFNDGSAVSVAAVDGNTVLWRLNRADSVLTTRDVMLPALAERGRDISVRRQLADHGGLFPLISGKQVSITTHTEWRPHRHGRPSRSTETWECRVGGTQPMQTPAGDFHTIRVDCTMQQSGSRQALHRTYFYAPSIGYYVRRDDQVGSAIRHVTLTAYSIGNPALADTAMRRRIEAIQLALEHRVSGSPVTWRDPFSRASGSVDPVLTVRSLRHGWCREFRERMQVAERDYDLRGTACRDAAGPWQMQEITPFHTASR